MESSADGDVADFRPKSRRVGLLYDDRMCKHTTPDGVYHPENPNRILSIWNKLNSSDIAKRCVLMNAKEAEEKHIALVHTKPHIDLIKTISSKKFNSRRNRIAASFNSIYFNEGSSEAASLAAGSVVEVAEKVALGELDSAFAIVRPPGHHAEEGEPMGFCLYNNVAIAASFILDEKPELGIKKILIVDWDVHHGNGTQKKFWKDSRVLFFSVHRHEFGTFYPTGDDGSYKMIGEGPGVGYNINVPWENDRCGDADYLAVWDNVLIPVTEAFNPDMIIISAGFDAALGDPLGGCRVTPRGYALMLSKLMKFAEGRIVMALEGGYNLSSIANSTHACLEVLVDNKSVPGSPEIYPFGSTWRVINAVRHELSAFWAVLAEKLPEKVTSKMIPHIQIPSSDSEDEVEDGPSSLSRNEEEDIDHIIQPFQNLKVASTVSPSWRSELSKIDIWYAAYGSNMRKSRFLCYIGGGQVEGMRKPCAGCMDKRPPKDITWRMFPHRLFFARDQTSTWGSGGVAFLHPESCSLDKAHMCLYRITLEQFNDVLLQENTGSYNTDCSFFDWSKLAAVKRKKSLSVEALKKGWYHNVVHLGDEADIPILTMTCTLTDVDCFKSGKLPMLPPGKAYADTLVKGLVEGNQLSEEEAIAYVEEATTKSFRGDH